jgi:REP element-mobilizing transposase RayT
MAHSYAQNHIHLVFSTKKRLKLIPNPLQPRLWAYVAGICKNHNMLSFAVGGMSDHIHVLFRLPPTLSLVRAVTLIKSNSSKWLRKKDPRFGWQQGYGAFSVSSSHVSRVIRYIDNQEAHHQKFTFEHEFITMLNKHHIPFDPEHVFD